MPVDCSAAPVDPRNTTAGGTAEPAGTAADARGMTLIKSAAPTNQWRTLIAALLLLPASQFSSGERGEEWVELPRLAFDTRHRYIARLKRAAGRVAVACLGTASLTWMFECPSSRRRA